MAKKFTFFVIGIVLLALLAAPAAASALSADNSEGSIIVTPSSEKVIKNPGGTKLQNQISEGEWAYHTRYVGTQTSTFQVTLTWDEDYGDLELYIYTPSGIYVGSYTDLFDSATRDGMINIDVSASSGYLPVGSWRINVYGRDVSGSSITYTLL